MRVFELAKHIGLSSKEIIDAAGKHGIVLKNHMVAVPPELEKLLLAAAKGKPVTQTPPTPTKKESVLHPTKIPDSTTKTPSVKSTPAQRKPVTETSYLKTEKSGRETRPVQIPKPAETVGPKGESIATPSAGRQTTESAAKETEPARAPAKPSTPLKKLSLPFPLRVVDLARSMERTVAELVGKLMGLGMMVSANAPLDKDAAVLLAQEYGYELELKEDTEELPAAESQEREETDDPKNLKPRPPVVVVMGHVDHGKTSLLDAIRKTRVAADEFGGITQHIGAYKVETGKGKNITFLDTPGHEAFTAMRARGANVTDLAVLVVAADDGVMPQTIEAISHARAANVPILVALNKIDKSDCDKQRVLKALSDQGLNPEVWGGDTVVVEVSALKATGISTLLEMIELQADLLDLKANPNRPGSGTVIESKLERGRGPTATVLVQKGTLRVGDVFVCGSTFGKVKALIDEFGRRLREAGPSTPAEVLGFTQAPQAGDRFNVVADEKNAKDIAESRGLRRKDLAKRKQQTPLTLEAMTENLREGEKPVVPLLLKTDVQGSLEAIRDALERLRNDEVPIQVLHAALGGITESDVLLAAASHATVLGFNVRPDDRASQTAEREGVVIRCYRIIYDLLNDVKKAVTGRMAPKIEERVIGSAEVRNIFKISKYGTVAGCFVKEGKIERRGKIRVVRDGVVTYEGKIGSLKRFKEDVRDVEKGYECGILVENFNDVKVGDIFEVFLVEELAPSL